MPYPELLELHFIEMKKFKKLVAHGKIQSQDRLAKWIEFITNEDDKQWQILASEHPIIKKAVERLEMISQNPENRWDYEIRQKALKDITSFKEGAREEGEVKGVIKGITKGKWEVALNMLQEGIDTELITKVTGFSEEEIVKLKENMKRD